MEIANSKLRRLLERNKTFDYVDIKAGGSVLSYKAPRKKSNPRRRGPATMLDIDESGVVLKFQPQPFKVARYCVRRKLEEKDLPNGTAMGDNQLNCVWEMSQPLVLPTAQGDPPDSAMVPDESSRDTSVSKEHDTQSTATPKLVPVEDSTDASGLIPRQDDPVPMSLESDGPVQESSPSDDSRTELSDHRKVRTDRNESCSLRSGKGGSVGRTTKERAASPNSADFPTPRRGNGAFALSGAGVSAWPPEICYPPVLGQKTTHPPPLNSQQKASDASKRANRPDTLQECGAQRGTLACAILLLQPAQHEAVQFRKCACA